MPNKKTTNIQVELILRGKVQGVTFRSTVQRWSKKLGLVGFVTNQANGTLYILAQGLPDQLDELIQKCYSGPERASVNLIIICFTPIANKFNNFTIQH